MSIPGSASPLFLASTAAAGGYDIPRSLRFNSADSAYLSKTFSSAGNRQQWTFSAWIKFAKVTGNSGIFECPFTGSGGTISDTFEVWYSLGIIQITDQSTYYFTSAARLRDPNAWGHLVIRVDTTLAAQADRIRLYWNGEQLVNTATSYPAQNANLGVNNSAEHQIGNWRGSTYSNLYYAEIHHVDGQSLDPTSFGEYDDSNVWQPIEYAGTYGTNGFKLDFSDNSSVSALGTDSSGNGNDWTVNNITVSGTNTYVSAGTTTASSGTVANGGTPYWVDVLPTNANLDAEGYSFDRVFDGILPATNGPPGLIAWAGTQYPGQGDVTRARFDLRDFASITSVRIWCAKYQTLSGTYTIKLLDSSKVAISGTSVSPTNTTGYMSWLTVPVSGSPAYIEFTVPAGNLYRLYMGAIEVNGTILLNNTGADNDALRDSPVNGDSANDTGAGGEVTGNYATWNPLCVTTNNTLSNGNLEAAHTAGTGWTGNSLGSTYAMFVATMGVTSGKWYWEGTFTSATTGSVGIVNAGAGLQYYVGSGAKSVGYTSTYVYNNGFGSAVASMPSYAQGDIIGVAIDMDNGKLYFSKNGTFINSGNPAAGTGNVASGLTGETVFPAVSQLGSSDGISFTVNFGQRAFAYTAPSGYKALCTANLPEPTIADGSTAFDTVLYTGDGNSTQTITGLNFAPDLTWQKIRNLAGDHGLTDSVRGVSAGYLKSNSTDLETGSSTNGVSAFTSDGFTAAGSFNTNNNNWVTWAWDGGSSTVTNTDGSISSQVRANPSAGFSIVSYTGNGTKGSTIGHGLNAAPDFVLCKRTDASEGWRVGHVSPGWTTGAYLHVADGFASTANDNWWNNTAPTNSVITLGTYPNTSTGTYICYAFTPVEQYSSFGSYLGNGSTDGPFVYTGFAVNFLLLKCSTVSSTSWFIQDLKRGTTSILFAQLPNQETTLTTAYPLSNGFKVNGGNFNYINGSGQTYIYAAFAEHPFKTARAR